MNTLETAGFYAELGWAVFPLAEGSKLPKIAKANGGRGFHDATSDAEQITAWWTRWPRANIGIRTGSASGLFVLDLDVRHRGEDSLERLTRRHGALPVTLTAATPSGGRHFYFAMPDVALRNSAGVLDDGLDTRAEGGYVAAAPSVVSRVGTYDWEHWTTPAPVPSWLVKLLRKPERKAPERAVHLPRPVAMTLAEKVLADRAHRVATAPQSRRNVTLNAQAYYLGTLAGAGLLATEAIWAELSAAAVAAGLAEREIRATIASGLSAGIATPARWAS